MRWFMAAVAVLCLIGCGGSPEKPEMSFLEADAIYKDEVATLEKMKEEFNKADQMAAQLVEMKPSDENKEQRNRLFESYNKLFADQEARVKAAEKAKEDAKAKLQNVAR